MGGERTDTKTSGTQQQSTQYTPTAEETELNKLDLANKRELNPQLLDVQKQGLEVSSQLLRGQALPGYLKGLPGGISPQVIQSLVDRSIRDIQPNMQLSGLLDSGVNASISARSSADIRNQSEQFNLQNLMQLLNVGVGGQAQVQAPIQGFGAQLSSRLSGLRNVNSSGSSTGSSITTSMNPFMKSFQTSFGSGLADGFTGKTLGQAIGCWVAAEVFGGWEDERTINARHFIFTKMPRWFRNFYMKFGEQFSKWLKDHRITRFFVKQIFNIFAYLGGK